MTKSTWKILKLDWKLQNFFSSIRVVTLLELLQSTEFHFSAHLVYVCIGSTSCDVLCLNSRPKWLREETSYGGPFPIR